LRFSEYKLYFGDIHGHSNMSLCGVCVGVDIKKMDVFIHASCVDEYLKYKSLKPEETIDLFYEFARDKTKLDFAALVDHDFSMSEGMWKLIRQKAAEWYSPGRFVTFSAYEWTSYAYGHRNVYFLTDDAPIFRCVNYGESPLRIKGFTPRDLWNFLRKHSLKALTIPHHPPITQFPVDWDYYDPEFDRAVEIVSYWGVFEYYRNPFHCVTSDNLPRYFVLDALERGYKLGIIGGSDSHDCRPGRNMPPIIIRNDPKEHVLNSLSQDFVPYFLINPLGTGLAGIYAKELTREALFEALIKRRVYAVVGDKIELEFEVDGHLMGEEIVVRDLNYRPTLRVRVEGTKEIDRVEIVRNGEVIYRKFCKGTQVNIKYVDDFKPRRKYNYYYVRVIQRNGSRAWSSPIWLIYENLGRLEAEFDKAYNVLTIKNSGGAELRHVKIGMFKEYRLNRSGVPKILEKTPYGAFFWVERKSIDEAVLRIRFKSNTPINFRGRLEIRGFEDYFVKPLNFAIVKYGGDLFTDDYKGYIEWDITPSSRVHRLDVASVKGFDITIYIDPFKEVYATAEVFQDGERDLAHTLLHETTVKEIPFKIPINEPKENVVEVEEIACMLPNTEVRIPFAEGTKYVVIYPFEKGYLRLRAEMVSLA